MRNLLKRTPFRLAATFSLFFITTVLALFTVIYLVASARLVGDIRDRVRTNMDSLAVLDGDRTFDDLVTVVAEESESVRDPDFIVELVDKDGKFLAGNVKGVPQSEQWMTLKRSDLNFTMDRGEPNDEFLALWKPLAKGRLLVGSDNSEVKQMKSFLLRLLAYGLLAMSVPVVLCAIYFARQTQHRIDAFANPLARVSQGHISARVPISGLEDDIDQVALQVNGMLGNLQRLIENVNQSSSDIAHDLKKPLGRLRQRLDNAFRKAGTKAEFQAALGDALLDIDSITETFDALLRITQIEAGARKDRFVVVDLRVLLADVHDVYDIVAEDAGDKLSFAAEVDGAAAVRGDPELLVQLFANLVENAIRHCPSGTQIRLQLSGSAGAYRVYVSDTGPGIPESERENVFRRLYRLERARSTDGSGLGLSLAAAIADLHGAKITLADNAPGLRVEVSFPAAEISARG
ncbi:HAMP domain-containing sensor histidine kinase [Hyphomicrobium sp.]|uniref:sensor histidine kinase n=1 Tax=Hyphomicrobium sp. TaxID=82 RepID=UPI002BC86183|nr:HAMP domain-containing sensor histidine kinase [Hyphomicrobium sp.]HVZ04823.1 HAMP domain-containing sensor histidine kinase [Hyphomicrobium sp.]